MGWIEKYLEYTSHQVSPRTFHFWSAVAVLGGVLERKVSLRLPAQDAFLYPGQIIVVLVSKSAVTKKSTAARMAVKFLRWVQQQDPTLVYLLPEKLSPQQLLYALQRLHKTEEGGKAEPMTDPHGKRVNGAGFFFASELGSMFTTESFAESLATHITNLNDAPSGRVPVEFRSWQGDLWNPVVGGLGCITPKGLARELPKAARTAGFFGRLLVVNADYTDKAVALLEEVSDAKKALRKSLRLELFEIAKMDGRYEVTEQARKWAVDWYHNIYTPFLTHQDLPENEQSGYWHRKESHMLRVGMVLAASESRILKLEQRHLEAALRELERIEKEFAHAFAQLYTNPYTDYDVNLLQTLERLGGTGWVPEQRLRRAMLAQGGDRRFAEARDTLKAAGEVELKREDEKCFWRRLYSTGRMLRETKESKE